ncbi:DUF1559 domain-containing protein [Planctomicrobium sp. SH661]|uniref:DUF1559 family PulG-like putative transporter n=1 Tax=Planctomicrobium sp. SH661 TaxID=3448124 RepID=UPI003F5C4985
MISNCRVKCLLLTVIMLSGCGSKTESPPPAAVESTPPAATPAAEPPKPDSAAMPAPAAASPAASSAAPNATTAPAAGDSKAPTVMETPLVRRVRQAAADAKKFDARSALKNIVLAMHVYSDSNGHLPAVDGSGAADSPTGLSWRVHLLPSLGEVDLYQEFHLDEPWDSEHNKALASKMPAVFGDDPEGKTRIQVVTGPGTPFQPGLGPTIRDVTDGTSNTLALVEAGPNKAETWTKPTGLQFNPTNAAETFGDVDEQFVAAMLDGSVVQVPVNLPSLARLIQHRDGAVIPSEDLDLIRRDVSNPSSESASSKLPPLAPAASEFDSKYLPSDASAALIISPRRIFESQLVQGWIKQQALEGETTEEALARLTPPMAKGSFPFAAVEEIRVLLEPSASPGAVESLTPNQLPAAVPGLYVRSAVSLPIEEIVRTSAKGADEVTVEIVSEIPHVRFKGRPDSIAFLSEKEMIVASNENLPKMLAAAPGTAANSKIAQALKAQGNPMVALAINAPEGQKLEFMQTALQAAGPAALFAPQLAETNAIRFALDLEAPEMLKLSLGFPHSQLSQSLSTVLQGLIAQGKKQGEMYVAQLSDDDPGKQAKSDLINELIKGVLISSEGSSVSLTLKHLDHLSEMPSLFQNQLAAAQTPAIPKEDLPPMEQIAIAMEEYLEANGHLPAASGPGTEEAKPMSARRGRGQMQGQGQGNDLFAEPPAEATPASPKLPKGKIDPSRIDPSKIDPSKIDLSKIEGKEIDLKNIDPNTIDPKTKEALKGGTASLIDEKMAAAIAKNKGLSWRVHLLPMLGQQELYDRFNLAERWDSPHNRTLLKEMPAVFGDDPEGKTRIHMLVGNETLFKSGKAPDLDAVRDVPEQTVVLIEAGSEKADFWTKPGGLPFDAKNPLKCLGQPDADQSEYQVVMLDWSVQTIPTEIEAAEFKGLVQPSDGQPARK